MNTNLEKLLLGDGPTSFLSQMFRLGLFWAFVLVTQFRKSRLDGV
jgi:hypothetical protein